MKYKNAWNNEPSFFVGKTCHDCPYEYNFYPPEICKNTSVTFCIEYIREFLPEWEKEWRKFVHKSWGNSNQIVYESQQYDINNEIWAELSKNENLTRDLILHFKKFWNYRTLSANKAIFWSLDLILMLDEYLRYEDTGVLEFWTDVKIFNLFNIENFQKNRLNLLIQSLNFESGLQTK